jgi:Protein of unknown function (DUF2829)
MEIELMKPTGEKMIVPSDIDFAFVMTSSDPAKPMGRSVMYSELEYMIDNVNKKSGLDFGRAISALKNGRRVAREGWNGKGLFIFMQVPATIPSTVIPNMQSLPADVKEEFMRRNVDSISYKNQLAMVYPDNTIYGWVASPSDVLEEDWCILD